MNFIIIFVITKTVLRGESPPRCGPAVPGRKAPSLLSFGRPELVFRYPLGWESSLHTCFGVMRVNWTDEKNIAMNARLSPRPQSRFFTLRSYTISLLMPIVTKIRFDEYSRLELGCEVSSPFLLYRPLRFVFIIKNISKHFAQAEPAVHRVGRAAGADKWWRGGRRRPCRPTAWAGRAINRCILLVIN